MPQGTFRLAAFSDLHLGKKKGPGLAWARSACAGAATRGADVLVCLGDLVDKKKGGPGDIEDAIALFRFITEDLGLPLIHVWGNHDVGAGIEDTFPAIDGVYRPDGAEIAAITVPGVPAVFHAANVIADPDPREVVSHFPTAAGPGHVGLLHSEVEGQYTKNPCLPTTVDALLSHRYDTWLLGHVHQPVTLHEAPFIGWVGMASMLELDLPAARHATP